MFLELLQKLGLSDKESALFLQVARIGSASASQLAEKVQLKRTTCYQIVEDMVRRGFMKRTMVGKTRYYTAKSPTELSKMLQKKREELQLIEKELEESRSDWDAFYREQPLHTEVTFYEGFDELASIYELMLQQEDDTIYSLIEKQSSENHVLQKFWQWYRKERIRRGIKSFSVVNKENDAAEYMSAASQKLRKVTMLPNNDVQLFGDVKVSGDTVAIMSPYKGRIWGVTIKDPAIATMFRGIIKTLGSKN